MTEGIRLAPLEPTDTSAIVTLWNRAARFDTVMEPLLCEKLFEDDRATPDLLLKALCEGQVTGFAAGTLQDRAGVMHGFVKMLAVDPKWQRRGIGSALLQSLESALRAGGAKVVRPGESAPNYLTPGTDVRYTRAVVFFESKGYERVGTAVNMCADLASQDFESTAAERELRANGIEVRRARPEDRASVAQLLDRHWPAWKPEVFATLTNDPISMHIACRRGDVLAFSAHEANNRGTGWFGPMGTDPDARGLGLGAVLLKRCLSDMKAMGYATATIPWVAPIGFYLHHVGAEISRVFFRHEKKLVDAQESE